LFVAYFAVSVKVTSGRRGVKDIYPVGRQSSFSSFYRCCFLEKSVDDQSRLRIRRLLTYLLTYTLTGR